MSYAPAAALDLAMHPLQTKVLRPKESAVAAARVEPNAQIFGKRCWYPPSLRSDPVAPLCRRTPNAKLSSKGKQAAEIHHSICTESGA